MRMKLIVALIVLSPLALLAQNPFKAKEGLWEVTVTRSGSGMPGIPEDTLAKMSPEQRARMEEAMKQHGMSSNGNTTVSKSCVTKEKLEKGNAFAENRENCTRTVVTSALTHMEVKLHCEETKNDQKTIMDGTFTVDGVGTDSAKGTTHMVVNSHGHTMNMDSTFTSKYLGPACGDVK